MMRIGRFPYSFVNLLVLVLAAGSLVVVYGQDCSAGDDSICDMHERCPVWKEQGECTKSRTYMNRYCPVSCGITDYRNRRNSNADSDDEEEEEQDEEEEEEEDADACTDNHKMCREWTQRGECSINPNYMHLNCAKSCGTCNSNNRLRRQQTAATQIKDPMIEALLDQTKEFGKRQEAKGATKDAVVNVIRQTVTYMTAKGMVIDPSQCRNTHPLCSFWAVHGECTHNPAWMNLNCGPACRSCDETAGAAATQNPVARVCLSREERMATEKPALGSGTTALNDLFQRMVDSTNQNRTTATVRVHSQPMNRKVALDHFASPWILSLDGFLTDAECESMILWGYNHGYSYASGTTNAFYAGIAWCRDEEDGCRADVIPARLHERVASLLDIPVEYQENFQIVKYEPGQSVKTRHDFEPASVDKPSGPRILTVFVFLTDSDPEEEQGGGEIKFPRLGLSIRPRKGRAVVWPNVYGSNLLERDDRMEHEMLPSAKTRDLKFTASLWIHLYDWLTPTRQQCE